MCSFLAHPAFVYCANCGLLAKPDRHYYRTTHVGQTVKFPCQTNLKEPVNWKRTDSFEYIYVMGQMAFGSDSRITVDKNYSYTLTIRNVTVEDSTSFRCVEDGGHGSRRFYHLTVTGSTCILRPRLNLIDLTVTGSTCILHLRLNLTYLTVTSLTLSLQVQPA